MMDDLLMQTVRDIAGGESVDTLEDLDDVNALQSRCAARLSHEALDHPRGIDEAWLEQLDGDGRAEGDVLGAPHRTHAAAAGLQKDDLVLQVGGRKIADVDALAAATDAGGGKPLVVLILREQERREGEQHVHQRHQDALDLALEVAGGDADRGRASHGKRSDRVDGAREIVEELRRATGRAEEIPKKLEEAFERWEALERLSD